MWQTTAFVSDLTSFPLPAMFLTKNSWQTAPDAQELLFVQNTTGASVTQNMQLSYKSIRLHSIVHTALPGAKSK